MTHVLGVGADEKDGIKRMCISLPYVKTFNSIVIKGYVPEQRSRYVFFKFRGSYVLSLRTFDVRFTHSHIMTMVHWDSCILWPGSRHQIHEFSSVQNHLQEALPLWSPLDIPSSFQILRHPSTMIFWLWSFGVNTKQCNIPFLFFWMNEGCHGDTFQCRQFPADTNLQNSSQHIK